MVRDPAVASPLFRAGDFFFPHDTKSLISLGVAVSNPTTSSMPASFGSAIVNPFEAIATTTSYAAMPMRSRYSRSACAGWILPAHVSLSV